MLRQLSYKHQTQPALAAPAGNAGDLLEEVFHLRNPIAREKLMSLLDDYNYGDWGLSFLLSKFVCHILLKLQAAKNVCDHKIINQRGVGIAQVDNRYPAWLSQL